MAEIHIHRTHALGLAEARRVADRWADEARERLGMDCSLIRGEYSDTVEFARSGVQGRLIVAADHFELQARLGFLLGAFSKRISSEIEHNLDKLLGGAQAVPDGATAARPALVKTAKAAKAAKTGKAARAVPKRPVRKAARDAT